MTVVKDGTVTPHQATDVSFHQGLVESRPYVAGLLDRHDGGAAALPHRAAMGRLLALVTAYTNRNRAPRFRGSSGRHGRLRGPAGHLQGPQA